MPSSFVIAVYLKVRLPAGSPARRRGKKSLLIRRDATLRISGALHLSIFDQPVRIRSSSNLLSDKLREGFFNPAHKIIRKGPGNSGLYIIAGFRLPLQENAAVNLRGLGFKPAF